MFTPLLSLSVWASPHRHQRDVLVAFLNGVAAVQSLDLGDVGSDDGGAATDTHEPKVFGSSTGRRAQGQPNGFGKKKKNMKAGDAETFRLRKLSITANDAAELAGTLEEIKAEEAVSFHI
jgi:hypothetical protein